MNPTAIETADFTSNPCTGCRHNCTWCYARGIAKRFGKAWGYPADDPFQPLFHPREIEKLLDCKKKCTVMLGSMCDLGGTWTWKVWMPEGGEHFLESPPNMRVCHGTELSASIVWDELLHVIYNRPNITFQVFTKNPENLFRILSRKNYLPPANLWIGTTVTNQADADARIPHLLQMREIGVKTLFVSYEPAMGQIYFRQYLYLEKSFDWLIVGAMTGQLAKKNHPERYWIQTAVDQCRAADVPVFCKSSIAKLFPDTEWPKEFPK